MLGIMAFKLAVTSVCFKHFSAVFIFKSFTVFVLGLYFLIDGSYSDCLQ